MKKQVFLLASLLISATTMLFAQQLEQKTIATTTQFPEGVLGNGVALSNIQIVDVLDNYLVCKKPLTAFNKNSDIFLLAKDLSSVKFLEIPGEPKMIPYHLCKVSNYYLSQVVKGNKQVSFALYDKNLNFIRMVSLEKYSNCAPVYLGKVGGNHFVKLMNGPKQFALATFDDQMNLIKLQPMERFGLICCDNNYIYLQNISLKAKFKDRNDGELIKMDKDMNIVLRKPITALWEQKNVKSVYKTVDTLGHTVFCNYGTYMAIDKETLEQAKLDFRSSGKGLSSLDTTMYDTDKIIRFVVRSSSLSISACDYRGNELHNREVTVCNSHQRFDFLEYKDNKVYVLLNEKKDIAIVRFDIATGVADTISSFQLEQNPGYDRSKDGTYDSFTTLTDIHYEDNDVSADIWRYDDNAYNLIVTTEYGSHYVHRYFVNREEHFTSKHWYNAFLSYIHLDKNFKPLKSEEETYSEVIYPKLFSYRIMHHSDGYTLLMQYKPDKEEVADVQFVIWDKSGMRKVVTTDLKSDFWRVINTPYCHSHPLNTPVIYKLSPNQYYILAGIPSGKKATPISLTELTVKP